MGGSCSTSGRNLNCITKFWSENLNGSDHSEDLAVDGKIILEWILRETGSEGAEWMHLAQERGQGGSLL